MIEPTQPKGTERSNEVPPCQPSRPRRIARQTLRIVAPLLVLATALTAAAYLMETGPQAERKPKARQARLVEVTEVQLADHPTLIEAWGQVRPAREVTVRAQVAGKVIEVSPELVPGGRFAANEMILRIDPADYELAVRQRESQLAKMRSELQVEQGNQVIARREYEILNENLSAREKSLVLRQPQLNAIQADIAAAQAALDEARLALRRTTIEAPFDAIVINRNVDLGARVTTSTDLATLVGTEEYWVELVMPITHLRWIDIPETPGAMGSRVRLYHESVWGPGVYRSGRVIRRQIRARSQEERGRR
jgi:multidrug efflux pump subunit AcrA (membrane-fusion protein)